MEVPASLSSRRTRRKGSKKHGVTQSLRSKPTASFPFSHGTGAIVLRQEELS